MGSVGRRRSPERTSAPPGFRWAQTVSGREGRVGHQPSRTTRLLQVSDTITSPAEVKATWKGPRKTAVPAEAPVTSYDWTPVEDIRTNRPRPVSATQMLPSGATS